MISLHRSVSQCKMAPSYGSLIKEAIVLIDKFSGSKQYLDDFIEDVSMDLQVKYVIPAQFDLFLGFCWSISSFRIWMRHIRTSYWVLYLGVLNTKSYWIQSSIFFTVRLESIFPEEIAATLSVSYNHSTSNNNSLKNNHSIS